MIKTITNFIAQRTGLKHNVQLLPIDKQVHLTKPYHF